MKKVFEWFGGIITIAGMAFVVVFSMMFAQGSFNRGKRSVLKKEQKEIDKRERRVERATDDIEKMSEEEIRRRSGQKGWFRD